MENATNFLTVAEVIGADGTVDPRKRVEFLYGRPVSWNDAAQRAVYQILDHSFKSWDRLSDVREYINYMITEMGHESTKNIEGHVASEYWAIFGSTAAAAGEKLGFFKNIDEELPALVDHISSVLVRKQKDYGHENIARFGRVGLLVRCHDKVARLENLLGSGKKPENETVADNFLDVIGYSAIGIMWERGWFMLPLE